MTDFEFPNLQYADSQLLDELAPKITELHEHHLAVAKSWQPSELIEAVYEARNNGEFDPIKTEWSREAKSSATLGLLTEDGLPYYTLAILRNIDREHPFARWGRRWTGEEGRHSIAIFGALLASGAVDMVRLENSRLVMMEKGETPNPDSFAEVVIYPTPQERITRLNHVGTARLIPGTFSSVKKVFANVASDENLHTDFYEGLSTAGFDVNPSVMTIAATKQIIGFGMPGQGIPGFIRHALRVSDAGIYGIPEQEKIFNDLIDMWGITTRTDLDSNAKFARDLLLAHMENMQADSEQVRQRREELVAKSLGKLQLETEIMVSA